MDWLIHHLVGDVVTHYWYGRQLKEFSFVRNVKQEFIVVSTLIRAKEIPDNHVLLRPDGEDVALVASVNNKPKVWTVHSPDSNFAQCNCPISLQGMICKHIMKAFQLLHSELADGFILREARTRCGVEQSIPLSQVLKCQIQLIVL
jgi:hypothetical protein